MQRRGSVVAAGFCLRQSPVIGVKGESATRNLISSGLFNAIPAFVRCGAWSGSLRLRQPRTESPAVHQGRALNEGMLGQRHVGMGCRRVLGSRRKMPLPTMPLPEKDRIN